MYKNIVNPLINEMKTSSALRDRNIHIEGIIDEDLAFEVCYFLNRIRNIDKKNNSKEDILLTINSYGGSIIHGNKIIGLIENMKSEGYKINSLTTGMAFSMAFDISICCSKRYAYRYAQFLLHQTQTGYEMGELKEIERDIEYQKRQWEIAADYYTKYTKIPKTKIDEIYNYKINYFFNSQEALELGVIDKIL